MKDQTVKELEQLYTAGKTARAKFLGTWYLNLSYYQNRQWLAWDGTRLWQPKLAANRITIVDNRITPCVRTEVAKMTKNRPVFTVTPRTGDEEDANASRLGDQLMRYLWKHLNMQSLSMKALLWSRICGAGFLKAFWDPSVGEGVRVLVGPNGQMVEDANGKPVRADEVDPQRLQGLGVRTKKVSQGDIRIEVRSPFQMLVDPLADSFAEVEWVIEESVKSTEYVKQRYGKSVDADTPANPGLIESRMGSSLASGTGAYKGTKIREYWCRPCSDHPEGRRAVWCQGKLLEEDNKPFDPMPYVMLSGIPVPGRLWPSSIVEHLRGPQDELNKVKSQLAENRNRVGNPTLLASRQGTPDPEKLLAATMVPGGTHFFDDMGSPNPVPKYLEPPQMAPYVVQEIERIEQSIAEISGQHEVTGAQVPPGVTAASAITLLQEADDTRLGPAITDYEFQLGALGQKVLKLAAHYYTDARTVKIGGDDGQWEIFDFRGSMLRDNTHVEVQAGSAFPQNKAAKQAMIQDLMTFFVQSGNPPHGRQLAQFLKDSEMGAAERLIEEYTKDEGQVNRENQRLLQGMPVQINDYDNDQAHIDGHTDFQKQLRYEQEPPQIKQPFEAHVKAHRDRLAQQQAAQLQMQAQAQGQPPPEHQQAQQQLDIHGAQQQQASQQQQAQQQMAAQAAQASQQLQGAAQQQGLSQAQAEQQQRHAEEAHHHKLRQDAEAHQQKLHQADEAHRTRMAQMSQQSQQQGGQSGR